MEKERIPDHNLILFDWLSVRIRNMDVIELVELLGMTDCKWDELEYGRHGYRHQITVSGVTILSDGFRDDMGICLEMSGSGCRYYESYGRNDWGGLISFCVSDTSKNSDIKLTRLDVAFDDHSGILDIDRLHADTAEQFYVSRSRNWKITYGSKGTSLYYGSDQSNSLIRIYDKAAERGFDPEEVHWIRLEMQLRDEIAQGFAKGFLERDLGEQFRGVLKRYLRFCVPSEDSNKARWATAPYWEELLESVSAIRCWESPGVEYNMENLDHFVFGSAGNGILTYIRAYGVPALVKRLLKQHDPSKYPKKYERLLDDRLHETGQLRYLSLMDLFDEWGGKCETVN